MKKNQSPSSCLQRAGFDAIKGHGVNPADLKYKEGDREQFVLEAQTTDKLVVFASNGRFYTITGDKLPPGRGLGEPLRLLVDIPNDADIVQTMVLAAGSKILVATRDGKGFIVSTNEILAQTKNGKTVMSVSDNGDVQLCKLLNKDDDHLALIGTNRKFLVFKLDQIPK